MATHRAARSRVRWDLARAQSARLCGRRNLARGDVRIRAPERRVSVGPRADEALAHLREQVSRTIETGTPQLLEKKSEPAADARARSCPQLRRTRDRC